jgi:hypothetical protein
MAMLHAHIQCDKKHAEFMTNRKELMAKHAKTDPHCKKEWLANQVLGLECYLENKILTTPNQKKRLFFWFNDGKFITASNQYVVYKHVFFHLESPSLIEEIIDGVYGNELVDVLHNYSRFSTIFEKLTEDDFYVSEYDEQDKTTCPYMLQCIQEDRQCGKIIDLP